MAVGEHLPEEDADGPYVALRRRVRPVEPLGRDVRERARDVSDSRERVGTVELREAEVEEADRDGVTVLDEDVRGLDVTVDDPGAVRVRERVEHLGGDLDRVLVRQLAGADRLAKGAAGHVLVCDVDVARVVADVVGPHAPVVPETLGCERLPLGTGSRLPLARDDLERDVESVPLVEREPHRPRAAGPERAHRPVATENEVLGGGNGCDGRHRLTLLAVAAPTPCSDRRAGTTRPLLWLV